MVKATMEIMAKAVILNEEGVYSAAEISRMYNISSRTLRRWKSRHKSGGLEGLKPIKPGPREAKHKVNAKTEQRILALKQKYPHWGAKRLNKRFQRKHVDSMWQGDTFQFRIHDVGKVYVTGFMQISLFRRFARGA